jgi:hypothetical protein
LDTNHFDSDFGQNAEQVLLVMESLLETNGHFSSKNFAYKFLEYNENGIKDVYRPPMMNATNTAVLANPTYKSSPVKKNHSISLLLITHIYNSNRLQLKSGYKKII